MPAVVAADQARERGRLAQELLKAVTADLKTRAEEAAVAKVRPMLCLSIEFNRFWNRFWKDFSRKLYVQKQCVP